MENKSERQTAGFLLSAQQRRAWESQQAGLARRAQAAYLIEGALDVRCLKNALEVAVSKHSIFRTTFQRVSGLKFPLQVIADSASHGWSIIDLSSCAAAHCADALDELIRQHERLIREEGATSLLQATLVTVSPQKRLMLVNLPESCADQWTLKNIFHEVVDFCSGLGSEADADELAQYVEYSEWQNEALEDEEARSGKDYWQEKQKHNSANFALPFEKRNASRGGFNPATVSLSLGPEERESVEARCKEIGVAASDVLLACWQALIWRLTESEATIHCLSHGRGDVELRRTMGPFAKWLPLSCELEKEVAFADLLIRTKEQMCEGELLREYCVEETHANGAEAKALRPFLFEWAEQATARCANGATFSIYRLNGSGGECRIKLSCQAKDDLWELNFDYDPATYCEADIHRLSRQFLRLLVGAVERPSAKIGELNFLTADESRILLHELNDTYAELPDGLCLHQRIEKVCASNASSIAVSYELEHLSYGEMECRSNQLGRYLQRLGVGPEVKVVVCMNRAPEMLIAILGIMKAGGAYAPVDPAYPSKRAQGIIEDSQARIIISQQELVNRLGLEASRIISLDREWEEIARESRQQAISPVCDDNLAYVIYTSGSTGKPKGVMITHKAVVNYLHWAARYYKAAEGNGSPAHTSVGFDLTVTSLFAPLMSANRVDLLKEGASVEQLSRVVRQASRYSFMKITPAHLQMLSVLVGEDEGVAVSAFVIGGEALEWEMIKRWQGKGIRIINEYGPTETTVGCSIYEVGENEEGRATVPIGRPIANARMYVIDESDNVAPTGTRGEIYIGGAGLARGYYNEPAMTAEKFLPDGFSQKGGERLYRAGDIGRYSSSGDIQYLGRADDQVKIRGYRVELGEIESALKELCDVKDAAVILKQEGGEKKIVGYIVTHEGKEMNDEEVKRCLRDKLPDYMAPSRLIQLDRLPLTANGKIDRRGLESETAGSIGRRNQYAAPRTKIEAALARIWGEALGLEKVGLDDNFFDIGGHSLLMLQAYGRIKDATGKEIEMVELFDHPTVRTLAAHLSDEEEADESSEEMIEKLEQGKNRLRQMLSQRQQLTEIT